MNEEISMFIDNELSIDEKLSYIKRLRVDPYFFNETHALLEQEKLLRTQGLFAAPSMVIKRRSIQDFMMGFLGPLLKPAGVMAVVIILVLSFLLTERPSLETTIYQSRLVVYQPEAKEMAVAGAFTAWEPLSMHAAGSSGYWEITLGIPGGEYRFIYIADGQRRFVDPTILTREKDDFGGENGILIVGQSI